MLDQGLLGRALGSPGTLVLSDGLRILELVRVLVLRSGFESTNN